MRQMPLKVGWMRIPLLLLVLAFFSFGFGEEEVQRSAENMRRKNNALETQPINQTGLGNERDNLPLLISHLDEIEKEIELQDRKLALLESARLERVRNHFGLIDFKSLFELFSEKKPISAEKLEAISEKFIHSACSRVDFPLPKGQILEVNRPTSLLDDAEGSSDDLLEIMMSRVTKKFFREFKDQKIQEVLYVPTKTYKNRKEGTKTQFKGFNGLYM